MNLTNEDVQEILRLLDASSFDELQLTTDRFKLTLRRSAKGGWTQETQTTAEPVIASPLPPERVAKPGIVNAANAAPNASSADAPATPPSQATPDLFEVRAPLIGTFYRAPKPGAAPFVEVGVRVSPDTVVGIVETMKLMNSVYAGAAGEVAEICAENGQLVEQGQVLMRLRTRA